MNEQILAVIIPAYNSGLYISDTLRSIQNQPSKDIKIIVVNDGSTDNTKNIVNEKIKHDNRIVLINQQNQGVSVARNTGIDYCIQHGFKYVAFLDSDDLWFDNFYTNKVKMQIFNGDHDLLHYNYLMVNSNITRAKKHNGSFASYIYKIEIIQRFNIRFPECIGINEDGIFHYIYSTYSKTCENKEYIFMYRNNHSSTSHNQFNVYNKYFNHAIKAWEFGEHYFKNNNISNSEKNIDYCRTMQKTLIAEFIQQSIINGFSYKRIQELINQSQFLDIYSDNNIWLDEQSKNIILLFKARNIKFYFKNRIKGLILKITKKTNILKFFDKKYYPIDLKYCLFNKF